MQSSLRLASAVACAALATTHTAHAQQAAVPQTQELPKADATPPDAQLGVVYVTARRRSEALDQVPVSVLVVSGEELDKMGATRFEDYVGSLPGLNWDNSMGFVGVQQSVRGIASSLVPTPNPLIQLYIGETPVCGYQGPLGDIFPNMNPIDLESIELLRGPQGTLFGSSAMGGALRLMPNEPDLYARSGWAEASGLKVAHGGNGYGVSAMANLPLVEGISALRLVAFDGNDGGWITNNALQKSNINATDSSGGRLSFRVRDPVWTVDAKIFFQHDHANGFNISDIDLPHYQQSRRTPEQGNDRWTLYNVTVERDAGPVRLVSTTSFLDRKRSLAIDVSERVDGALSVPVPSSAENWQTWGEFTQELRAQGHVWDTDWLVGAFYQRRHYAFIGSNPTPGLDAFINLANPGAPDAASFGYPDNLSVNRTDVRQQQIAFFLDASFHPTEKIELTAGAREFHFSEIYVSDADGIGNGGPSHSASSSGESGVTPRFSAAWHPLPHQTLYASVAQGFRPGGTNDPTIIQETGCGAELASLGYTGAPGPYHSDRLVSYELGAKLSSAGGRLLFNTALFHIDWSGIQTQHFLNCGTTFVQNAGKAASDGIEIDLKARLARDLLLSFNGAYTDARLVQDNANLGAKAGDRLAGVPLYTATAALTWDYAEKSFVRVDYQQVGRSFNAYDPYGAPNVPAYGFANFVIAKTVGAWQVSARVKNIFDSDAAVSRHRSIFGQWDSTIPPRTFLLSARYSW